MCYTHEQHILEICSVLWRELESSISGMIMLKPFAEAVIDCFQACLADYVLRLPISGGPLDKLDRDIA